MNVRGNVTISPMKTASFLIALLAPWASAFAAPTGEEVYKARCAACHDQVNERIPPKDGAAKDAFFPDRTRARFGRDDGHRVPDQSRRPNRGGFVPGNQSRDSRSTSQRVLQRPHRKTDGQSDRLEWMERRLIHGPVSIERSGRPQYRRSAQAQTQVGIRIRRGRHRVRGANGSRRTSLCGQRWRRGACDAGRERMPRMDLSGEWPGALRHHRCAARQWTPPRPALRRYDRLVLRARSRVRQAALEGSRRGSRFHTADRRPDCVQRRRLRAGCFLGRDARVGCRLSVLHVSRQRGRAEYCGW